MADAEILTLFYAIVVCLNRQCDHEEACTRPGPAHHPKSEGYAGNDGAIAGCQGVRDGLSADSHNFSTTNNWLGIASPVIINRLKGLQHPP